MSEFLRKLLGRGEPLATLGTEAERPSVDTDTLGAPRDKHDAAAWDQYWNNIVSLGHIVDPMCMSFERPLSPSWSVEPS